MPDDEWMDFSYHDTYEEEEVEEVEEEYEDAAPYHERPESPVEEKSGKSSGSFSPGGIIGVISIIIIIIGILMPWYFIDISLSGDASTNGRVKFMEIGGIHGIVINIPDSGNNSTEVMEVIEKTFPILGMKDMCCLSFIMIFIVHEVWVLARYHRAEEKKKPRVLLYHGLGWLLPLVIVPVLTPYIILFIFNAMGADVPPEVMEMISSISSSVFGGHTTFSVEKTTIELWWGFATGMWLMLSGAAGCVIGGIVEALSRKND